jgi:hypothetical protein
MVTSWNSNISSSSERLLFSAFFLAAFVSMIYAPYIPTRGFSGEDWASFVRPAVDQSARARALSHTVGSAGPTAALFQAAGIEIVRFGSVEGTQWMVLASWILMVTSVYALLFHATESDRPLAFLGAVLYGVIPPLSMEAMSVSQLPLNLASTLANISLIFFLRGMEQHGSVIRHRWWIASTLVASCAVLCSGSLLTFIPGFIAAWILMAHLTPFSPFSYQEIRCSRKTATVTLAIIFLVIALYSAWRIFLFPHADLSSAINPMSSASGAGNGLPVNFFHAFLSACTDVFSAVVPWIAALLNLSDENGILVSTVLPVAGMLFAALFVPVAVRCIRFLTSQEISFAREKSIRLFILGSGVLLSQFPWFLSSALQGASLSGGFPPGLHIASNLGTVMLLLAGVNYLHRHLEKNIATHALVIMVFVISVAFQWQVQHQQTRLWRITQAFWTQMARSHPDFPANSSLCIRYKGSSGSPELSADATKEIAAMLYGSDCSAIMQTRDRHNVDSMINDAVRHRTGLPIEGTSKQYFFEFNTDHDSLTEIPVTKAAAGQGMNRTRQSRPEADASTRKDNESVSAKVLQILRGGRKAQYANSKSRERK